MASVDDIKVGDQVNVPGGMYGTVKFIGTVAGKPGRFAGVELGPEHAGRGKNNGDVEGRNYFTTSVPGSGIFVPINNSKYVSKRTTGTPPTPTPSRPSGMNFSKSVGPSPSAARPRIRRPSLPRPESPRTAPPSKLNLSGLRTPSAFSKSTPAGGNAPRTPLKTPTRPGSRVSQATDTPNSSRTTEGSRTPRRISDDSELMDKVRDLEKQLQERDKQLEEQSATLADFQKSITELEGSDALQVRAQLREKNEKIAALTAEFDSHRADFRSTLDTLEVAASETERVYEKRLDELMQANRDLQDRGEDVETVARQLKQLEELVSELEEGLEDARRGEAEARGEVEFLRGEVERTRLELKQEREKSAAALKDAGVAVDGAKSAGPKDLDQKDDEIRGLKAIIHSLSRGEAVTSPTATHQNGATLNGSADASDPDRISKLEHRIQELEGLADRKTYRIEELEQELNQAQPFPASRNSRNRSGTVTASPSKHHKSSNSTGANSNGPNHAHRLSDRTVVPGDWRDSQNSNPSSNPSSQHPSYPPPLESHRQLETMHESESRSSGTDDEGSLWCEICETGGHDILTCTNMFGNNGNANKAAAANPGPSEMAPEEPNRPDYGANPGSNGSNSFRQNSSPSQRTGRDAVLEGLKGIGGLTASMAPVAGKASGVIDETRWCALCERDGHESIDCPFDE